MAATQQTLWLPVSMFIFLSICNLKIRYADMLKLIMCTYMCSYYTILVYVSMLIIILIVPAPAVDVTSSHTPPLYAGSSLTLTCTVTLDPNVNNDETTTIEWMSSRGIHGEWYTISHDSLTISPLTEEDDGTYTCNVTVTGGMYVHQVTASDDYLIPTIGKAGNWYILWALMYINTFEFTGIVNATISDMRSTSLVVKWEFLSTSKTVSTYSISYSNTNNTQCFTDSNNISDISASETMYNLTGLQEATEYSITVTAILSDGETAQDNRIATTLSAG